MKTISQHFGYSIEAASASGEGGWGSLLFAACSFPSKLSRPLKEGSVKTTCLSCFVWPENERPPHGSVSPR